VKKLLQIALGIVTSVGGFLEVGSIATAAQAGADFRFSLLWAIAASTICIAFLVEMVGRLAAVSRHTFTAAVRERFGFRFHFFPLLAEMIVDCLVLAAEIGGVCTALHLLTGISVRVLAIPVAFGAWLILWRGTFGVIEYGVSLLGLTTVVFIVGAFRLHPAPEMWSGLVPRLPRHDLAHYGFIAVSILGATLSPYLLNFYSSGAVEERWNRGYLSVNRWVAGLGMGFGGVISMGVLVCAALVLQPQGIRADDYEKIALILQGPFPSWGRVFFAVALGIACFGAVLEIGLNLAYVAAQALGWNWSQNIRPAQDARFSLVYTLALVVSALLVVAGIDPLKLTLVSMALTAVVLPLIVFPLLALMNDRRYLGTARNGLLGNIVVAGVTAIACVVALLTIPLEILGGS
jgi:Mn2+/Fe2+ NRAMP family transporter